MDIFTKTQDRPEVQQAVQAGLYPYFITFDDDEGPIAHYHGQRIIMCGSNNYLGLTIDPRVKQASTEAIAKYGTSCTGSRFLNGNIKLHEELENAVASFLSRPAGLVFPTGFQTNQGVIGAVVGKGDLVLLDDKSHASAIDGARLSKANVDHFAHNDSEALEIKLKSVSPQTGVLIVVDGVYSMSGDICRLPEILEVAHRYDARVLLDDAHGLGVLAQGHGTEEYFRAAGMRDKADLITVTFSKSLASIGGAVVGSQEIISRIKHRARTEIFSASMTPASAAAALAALSIITREPWRCDLATHNADYVRTKLSEIGIDTGTSRTPIIPILVPNMQTTLSVWKTLLKHGIYANPVVPPGASFRLRLSFMTTHTVEQLAQVVDALRDSLTLSAPAPAKASLV